MGCRVWFGGGVGAGVLLQYVDNENVLSLEPRRPSIFEGARRGLLL